MDAVTLRALQPLIDAKLIEIEPTKADASFLLIRFKDDSKLYIQNVEWQKETLCHYHPELAKAFASLNEPSQPAKLTRLERTYRIAVIVNVAKQAYLIFRDDVAPFVAELIEPFIRLP